MSVSHLFSAGALTDTFSSEGWKTSVPQVCTCTASRTGSRQVELPFALKENCECEYFCEATICEML